MVVRRLALIDWPLFRPFGQRAVFHLGAATLDVANPKKTFLNFRNNRLMLYKNLPPKERRKIFFMGIFYKTATCFPPTYSEAT